jgi:uracil phosphoribosyltransferase
LPQIIVNDHPLVQHRLTLIRDRSTPHEQFRQLVHDMTLLLAYDATKGLEATDVTVETPLAATNGKQVKGDEIVVVAVLRAGLGMVQAMCDLIPGVRVGHLGMFRDEEKLTPVQYYARMPDNLADAHVIILDPMLATGGSMVAACDILKKNGARHISAISLISAPEGVALMQERHPDVQVYTASIDERLNEKGYIVPGLGDAGDRQFGTYKGV